jgi:hypothetical protein
MADRRLNLQRGHPVDILVQALHGNAESTVEEASAISPRIGEFRAFLKSLHPLPLLSPMAQGQQLGVDSQANAQTPSDMNDQLPEPAAESEDLQDSRTVPGEIIGAGTFDEPLRPTNPYSAEQYQHALELRQRAGLITGTMLMTMVPCLTRKPVFLTTVTPAFVHRMALRVLLQLNLHQTYPTKRFIGTAL